MRRTIPSVLVGLIVGTLPEMWVIQFVIWYIRASVLTWWGLYKVKTINKCSVKFYLIFMTSIYFTTLIFVGICKEVTYVCTRENNECRDKNENWNYITLHKINITRIVRWIACSCERIYLWRCSLHNNASAITKIFKRVCIQILSTLVQAFDDTTNIILILVTFFSEGKAKNRFFF